MTTRGSSVKAYPGGYSKGALCYSLLKFIPVTDVMLMASLYECTMQTWTLLCFYATSATLAKWQEATELKGIERLFSCL